MNATRKVAQGLAALESLDHSGLKARWKKEISRSAPKAASRLFLLRALSYELQAKYAPGLSKADQKVLSRSSGNTITQDSPITDISDADGSVASTTRSSPSKPRIALVPGSRLVREWNRKPYTVSVIEEGFVYEDKVWSSLSAIAKDITGAHWSGPRFFGLNTSTVSH